MPAMTEAINGYFAWSRRLQYLEIPHSGRQMTGLIGCLAGDHWSQISVHFPAALWGQCDNEWLTSGWKWNSFVL